MAKIKEAVKSQGKVATVKYPGTLGQPYKHSKKLAAALEGNYDWLDKHELQHMEQLLNYYKIAVNDPYKWLALSFALARDHVPAFKVSVTGRRGRPIDMDKLFDKRLQELNNPRAKPGRPKKFTDDYYRRFIEAVDRICTENSWVGRGRIKRAIEIYLTHLAQKSGWSVTERRNNFPVWYKRYFYLKNKIPEIGK